MKVLIFILLLLPIEFINAQKIGEIAPDKGPEIFPDNTWGMDIMFGEGGFGLGTFYRRSFSQKLSGFIDFSISETKDEREFEYIDYWGNTYSPYKLNRSFLLPVNFGLNYRLFEDVLTESLRPYIGFGAGPTLIVVTPYEQDFFASFGNATMKYAVGGYVGFGANFGSNKKNVLGINVRYYYTHIFGEGIENIINTKRNDFGHFYISLNLGIMY